MFTDPVYPIKLGNDKVYASCTSLKDPLKDPPCRKLYPLDAAEWAELKGLIEQFLVTGHIAPLSSPYRVPILLAKKKYGGLRMCIDYHKLNSNIVVNSFPLPCINDLL